MTKKLSIVVLVALAASLAFASFTAVTLRASSPVTSGGTGDWIAVPAGSQIGVLVDITAYSGTVSAFDLWCQATNDSTDANGWDVPADSVLQSKLDGSGTTGTLTGPVRDIVDGAAIAATARAYAVYKSWPAKYIRVRHQLAGSSTPTVTYSAVAGVK